MSAPSRLPAPRRPTLGALAPAALGAWAAVLAVERASWAVYAGRLDTRACAFILASLFGMALAFSFLALRAPARLVPVRPLLVGAAVFFSGSALCAACAALFWHSWAQDVEILQQASPQGVRVELASDPVQRDYGTVSTGRVFVAGRALSVRVLWPEKAEPLTLGHAVEVDASYTPPADDGGGSWNHCNGFAGMLCLTRAVDAGAAGGLGGAVCAFRDDAFRSIERIGGEGAALLAGVLVGNRTLYAGSELEQDFKTCGLAHLMAVSGTHLAVVTALLSCVLRRSPCRRAVRAALLSAALVFYVALTGFSPSALRAGVMCVVALVAAGSGRRRHVCTALAFCVVAFLALEPANAYSLSFLLSVLSVFGLLVLGPLASCWVSHVLPARLSRLGEGVGVTLAATLVTLPVTVPLFAQFPLVVPLATLLAAPLVTLCLGAGVLSLAAGVVAPPVGDVLLAFACAVANATAWLVHRLADLPLACIPLDAAAPALAVGCAALVVALWVFWPVPRDLRREEVVAWRPVSAKEQTRAFLRRAVARLLVACCLCLPVFALVAWGMGRGAELALLAGTPATSGPQIVMLDVGQGDAMLVRDGGAAVLIDTGEEADVLSRALARQAVTHLDAVFISHKDADHAGALSGITGVVSIDHVYVHADLLDDAAEAEVLEAARRASAGRGAEGVRPGSSFRVGAFTVEVLAPEDGGKSGNDDSLQMLISCDADADGRAETRGFTSGDAEAQAIAGTVDTVGDVDFVKVPHHGSRGGFDEDELAVLCPEIALVSVGADNDYGHPTRQMLELLAQARAKVYRTDEMGDVALAFSADSIEVAVQKAKG